MSFILNYLYYNYKLAFRTRDKFKAPGLILLGKLGDRVYKSPVVVIVYSLASILILTFFAGYSAEALPSDPILGLNFVLLVPAFIGIQILFDWFGQNNQLSSYQTVLIINSLTVKERVKLIFLTEFFGIKFISLILCVGIVQICNSVYFGFTIHSLVVSLCFFVSLFVIYNSIVSILHPCVSKLGNKVFVMLLIGMAVAAYYIAANYTSDIESSWIAMTIEVFDRFNEDPYMIPALIGLSLLILFISIFVTKLTLRNSWQY